jgi:CTP:molybdopterin cytidylyltransferase MocA
MAATAARVRRRLACVLLAAGASRRLGAPKQLLRSRGRSLLLQALGAARAAAPSSPLIVVLGAHALRLRGHLRRNGAAARAVTNAGWDTGLASSLQAGLAAVPSRAEAVLVLLTDQPEVGAAALRRLIAAWRRRPSLPAAARYAGRVGVPAILPRRTWRAVRELDGDVGARALLRDAAEVTLVAMPEAELDIDTPADAARLR